MAVTSTVASEPSAYRAPTAGLHAAHADPAATAVSWGAIFAGAAGAAALSLILLILGTGLGLSSVSPWEQRGISAAVFGVSTILWLGFTQVVSAGMGGYLAGRLRARWLTAPADEVYFRDTAHGFLAWAVASLATAAWLTSAIGGILGGGLQAGASIAGGAAATAVTATAAATGSGGETVGSGASPAAGADPMNYFIDSLFRGSAAGVVNGAPAAAMPGAAADAGGGQAPAPMPAAPHSGGGVPGTSWAGSAAEAGRIFMNSIATGALPPEDQRYVAHLVSQRTGLSQPDAEKRVSDVYARMQAKLQDAATTAREAADKARKASAYGALWLFVSLLMGAFAASLAATYGGRQRDL